MVAPTIDKVYPLCVHTKLRRGGFYILPRIREKPIFVGEVFPLPLFELCTLLAVGRGLAPAAVYEDKIS